MNSYIQLLIICFLVALGVNYFVHKKKEIKRGKYGVLVIGLISGFVGFILSLMLLSKLSVHWIILGSLVSGSYAYIMANAKGFNFIK